MQLQVKITIDEIREMVAETIKKKFGFIVKPENIEINYSGSYDDLIFDGMSVTIDP